MQRFENQSAAKNAWPAQRTHLIVQAVLGAKGADQLLRLPQVVPWQGRKQVVLHLAVQPAGEPKEGR